MDRKKGFPTNFEDLAEIEDYEFDSSLSQQGLGHVSRSGYWRRIQAMMARFGNRRM